MATGKALIYERCDSMLNARGNGETVDLVIRRDGEKKLKDVPMALGILKMTTG